MSGWGGLSKTVKGGLEMGGFNPTKNNETERNQNVA